MTRDEARKVIIAACFQDASGEKNYIENAIEKIVAAAKIEGLKRARQLCQESMDFSLNVMHVGEFARVAATIADRIDAEIAKLEKP